MKSRRTSRHSARAFRWRASGISLLEIIVVIAIVGIISAISFPNIQDWLAKRRLQSEYLTLTAKLEYLRLKARTLPGTATLRCAGNRVTTEVRLANNTVVESDPPAGGPTSLLQYPTQVLVSPCANETITFASNGTASGTSEFSLVYAGDNLAAPRYGAYGLALSSSTGFIRKYRCPPGASCPLKVSARPEAE